MFMFGTSHKMQAILGSVLALHLLLAACSGAPPATVIVTPPVVIITQVVTQIIAPTPIPVTPTAEIKATDTPVPPTAKPTFDPLSAPIYYPLGDCVASRLHVGDIAMVSLVGGANGIRYGRNIAEDAIAGYAQPGAKLEIVNGPWCSQGWLVWLVRTSDGLVGYTPEGNGNEYWLFPTAP
jgi:hypothetical protein